jgi:quinol monooxygenase YgiN
MSPLTVVARWQVQAGAVEQVLALAAQLRRESLAEEGCLGYEVYRNVEAPASFVLVERYRDQAALDAHRESAHYQRLVVEGIRPWLEERQVEILKPAG